MILTSSVIAAFLSLIFAIVLIVVWILNPKWRSLHNYISINQIVVGTLHLIVINLDKILEDKTIFRSDNYFLLLKGYLYLASTCWSLCASLHAYLRLVLVYTGTISYGKRKATVFSIGTLLMVKSVSDLIVPYIYNLRGFNQLFDSRMLTIYVLTVVNLFIFIRVIISVMPCCKGHVVKKKGKRMSALLGVAVLCDVITSVNYILTFLGNSYISNIIFNYRLIPFTIIVLFSKASNDYWKTAIKRRRRRKRIQTSRV